MRLKLLSSSYSRKNSYNPLFHFIMISVVIILWFIAITPIVIEEFPNTAPISGLVGKLEGTNTVWELKTHHQEMDASGNKNQGKPGTKVSSSKNLKKEKK